MRRSWPRPTAATRTGKPISVSRELTLPGQEVYFDTLVIKFDDHFVEQGDPLKGQALMLFRRIFSSTMRPEDGFVIDKEGQPPEIYAGGQAPSDFEKELWKRFWELANDEKLAKEHESRYLRFKADESSQAITGPYRQSHPEDNNERQAVHEHVSVPLPALTVHHVETAALRQTQGSLAAIRPGKGRLAASVPSTGASK